MNAPDIIERRNMEPWSVLIRSIIEGNEANSIWSGFQSASSNNKALLRRSERRAAKRAMLYDLIVEHGDCTIPYLTQKTGMSTSYVRSMVMELVSSQRLASRPGPAGCIHYFATEAQ